MSRIPWPMPPPSGNDELDSFLFDLLDAVKDLDRQGLATVPEVTQTAGASYTNNEQAMLESLKTAVNGILGNT